MTDVQIWQGSYDAFCGLYSASYVIAHHQTGDKQRGAGRAFYKLLQSAEKLSLLTADRIAIEGSRPGFTDRQVARIINGVPSRMRANLTAVPFRSAEFREFEKRGRKQLIQEGASAIIQQDGNAHWIAITAVAKNGSYCVFDPWQKRPTASRDRIVGEQGVLIIPADIG